ncbi:hypothetical protein, partial [Vibrio anguillarum]|uniref:hypothetical protein n=1 Tax=Vibrio anguillarum TaxID=55601 RepID=UPI001BE4DC2D
LKLGDVLAFWVNIGRLFHGIDYTKNTTSRLGITHFYRVQLIVKLSIFIGLWPIIVKPDNSLSKSN